MTITDNTEQKASEPGIVATNTHNSSDRSIILTAIFFTVALVGLTVMFIPDILKADGYARYSFSVSGLVAVALFVYSLYFAKRDSVKTQSILDDLNKVVTEQAKIISRVDEVVRIQAETVAAEWARQERRKQVWAKIAYVKLTAILSGHEELYKRYMYLLEGDPTDDYLNDLLKWAECARGLAKEYYVPEIDDALSHIVELLNDPSLFNDIRGEYRNFYDIFNMAGSPQTIETIDQKEILGRVQLLNGQEKIVKKFIERVSKEIPNQKA